MPDALLSEQVQRLAVCTAVGAGLWTYGLVMDAHRPPGARVGADGRLRDVVIEIAAIAICGADVPLRALRAARAAARRPTPASSTSC